MSISNCSYTQSAGKFFSEAVTRCNLNNEIWRTPSLKHSIHIKPQNPQGSAKTRQEIEKCINPADLKMSINRLKKKTKNGMIQIDCGGGRSVLY